MTAPTPRDSVIAGLDIGTSKVACVVGERNSFGGVDIIGIGSHPSRGLRKGNVINIEDTVHSIQVAVDEAEMMAGVEVNSVYTNIAGGHIHSVNSAGMVPIRGGQVAQTDVDKVLEAAQTIAIPTNRRVIHVIPQQFKIDEQEEIDDPRGMSGVRLSSEVHIVTAAVAAAQNIIRCCELMRLGVRDIVLGPLASAEAVLTADEKELGVLLIDIGGGTTDLTIYSQGAVLHSFVLPVGGNLIDSDIAYALAASNTVAERIKQDHGCALRELVDEAEPFDFMQVGGDRIHSTNKGMLCEVIEPRVSEIFELLAKELQRVGHNRVLPAGVVVTGGGSLLPGILKAAERFLGMPARRGVPREIGGLSDVVGTPEYATGVGLVKFGLENYGSPGPFGQAPVGVFAHLRGQFGRWFDLVF
ncbi:MAG: cell division protein FtsA [Rickettsiales bacterium]|nr:cell division protein FtsA [Rickettsiales bacterium]